jgi:effector-binding domain-containing protein
MSTDITETRFAPRTYLVWRKKIAIAGIADHAMWQTAFGKVHEYIQRNNVAIAGPGSALYFTWDENAGYTDFGIGNAVAGLTDSKDRELSLVPVHESKAVQVTLRGGYEQLREVHRSLQAYVKQHNLKPALTIEEYTVMGMDKPDPKDWETNVYYLYE